VESKIKETAKLCSDLIRLKDSVDALNFCEAFLSGCGLDVKRFCFKDSMRHFIHRLIDVQI